MAYSSSGVSRREVDGKAGEGAAARFSPPPGAVDGARGFTASYWEGSPAPSEGIKSTNSRGRCTGRLDLRVALDGAGLPGHASEVLGRGSNAPGRGSNPLGDASGCARGGTSEPLRGACARRGRSFERAGVFDLSAFLANVFQYLCRCQQDEDTIYACK